MYRAKVYGVAGFERQFAVKRFHSDLVAQPVVSQRLSAAARAYGSLEHPRIARLHEYGVAAGEVFTATEMVAGLDVMRLVAMTHQVGEPLPPGAALALITQAARAIGYAHGRGVNHLGLCPTNVIVTPDGDVKITDVGVFAQTLTIRPSDDERLTTRIHYLAPEQLVNEPVSAATDVFALGTLIHELVTGERAFVGVTPLDVEHAILSGHVRDCGLPKPMARVLARCFARSPFERFPDARALADAIDAALRVAPVVGGRRELSGIVKEAVARIEAMNEGQLSGAMVLAMPMAPREKAATAAPPPREKFPSVAPVTVPAAIAPPPRRQKAPTRPPPIQPPSVVPVRQTRIAAAVPPPVQVPPIPIQQAVPRAVTTDEDSEERTLNRDPVAPQMSPLPGALPPSPPSRTPNASPLPFNTASPSPQERRGGPPPDLPALPPGADFDVIDAEPEPEHRPPLRLDSAWPTGNHDAIPDGSTPLADGAMRPSEPLIEMIADEASEGVLVAPPPPPPAPSVRTPLPAPPPVVVQPPPLPEPERYGEPPRRGRGRGVVITALFLMLCGGIGVGAVYSWNRWLRDAHAPEETEAAKPTEARTVDAGVQPTTAVAAVKAVDAGAVAAAKLPDAGAVAAAKPVDAGALAVVATTPDAASATDSGPLVIDSEPHGARVFVDGADEGTTPAKIAGGDKHSIAVVMPGYDLYTADVDGGGTHVAKLKEVTPPAGPAGIKVKCNTKGRYYVYVDGAPTGELCPTERLGVEVGNHTVEIYDLVSEERQTFPANTERRNVTGSSLHLKVD